MGDCVCNFTFTLILGHTVTTRGRQNQLIVCVCVCRGVTLSRRGWSSLPSYVPVILSRCVLEDCPCWAQDLHLAGLFGDFSSPDRHRPSSDSTSCPSDLYKVSRCRCLVPCPWHPWVGCCRPGRRTSCLWKTCCSLRWPGRSPTKVSLSRNLQPLIISSV